MMFNPKITDGEWELRPTGNTQKCYDSEIIEYSEIGPIEVDTQDCVAYMWVDKEDASAIAAVPELLEVYKAAKWVNERRMEYGRDADAENALFDAIKALEERHCNK